MTTGCLPKLFWTQMEQCDSNDACVAVKFVEAEFIKLPGAERIRMRPTVGERWSKRHPEIYTKNKIWWIVELDWLQESEHYFRLHMA